MLNKTTIQSLVETEGGVRVVASIFVLHLDSDFTRGHYCHFVDKEMRFRQVV